MSVIRLTKEFTFEAAHMLEGYDGLCREIHGHSYRLFVTIKGEPQGDAESPKLGMVMDFGLLKRIVNEQIVERLDHSFMMRNTLTAEQVANDLGYHFSKIELRSSARCSTLALFLPAIKRQLPKNLCHKRT